MANPIPMEILCINGWISRFFQSNISHFVTLIPICNDKDLFYIIPNVAFMKLIYINGLLETKLWLNIEWLYDDKKMTHILPLII